MELWQTMGERAAQLMQSRAGRNGYTQGSKRKYFWGYPDNEVGNTSQAGYSDCSSAARSAILAAAGIDIGSNTNAQIKNRAKGQIVHETEGYYPDESQLLPGDCLYFKGNTGHALDVGHVEMYIGNGQICGHGSGTGPRVKDMREYCRSRADSRRRYFMAIRWVVDGRGSHDGGAGGALGERLLKRGCAGADVKEMQDAASISGLCPAGMRGGRGIRRGDAAGGAGVPARPRTFARRRIWRANARRADGRALGDGGRGRRRGGGNAGGKRAHGPDHGRQRQRAQGPGHGVRHPHRRT